ncbi:hypothetical protein LTR09_005241 [Extremus antarcticus]|uniref:Uncharacterized protein n=1 Tax=Extremus antarcticus TaxID=702011 RepID=A0AAJ0DHD0_9PEZI|nr:hypothetical protein LTR09_005241 [Extremus antarcticus]
MDWPPPLPPAAEDGVPEIDETAAEEYCLTITIRKPTEAQMNFWLDVFEELSIPLLIFLVGRLWKSWCAIRDQELGRE